MSKERTIKLYGDVIDILIPIIEKAYFTTKDSKEKKLLAGVLSKLQ